MQIECGCIKAPNGRPAAPSDCCANFLLGERNHAKTICIDSAKNLMWNSGAASMITPAEYQSYAQECLRWTAETDNDERRQAFLEMAKVWTHFAIHGANGQHQTSSIPPNDWVENR
jgi:hypothetical protein